MEKGGKAGQGRRLAAQGQGLIAALLGAVLYVLAFPPFDVPETAYVFAIPLLLHALFSPRIRGEGWWVFFAGWAAWFVLVFWLRNVTGHLSGGYAVFLGWFALFGLSGVLALFWWAWMTAAMAVVRTAKDRVLPARLGALLGLAGFWVVMEWLRGVLFTGFPWLKLEISQWERPLLLQTASLTGGAGIAFVLVAFNLGLAFYLHGLWRNRRERWWRRLSPEFYLALVLLFGAIAFGLHSSGSGRRGSIDGPRIAFVQPDVGAFEKWDPALARENLDVLADLTTYASYLEAELVLWPESPTPMPVKGNPTMRAWVEDLSRQTGIPLLIGNIAIEGAFDDPERRWYNAVFTVDPEEGVETERYYAKRHLVPFGEYVPLADWIPFLREVVPVPGDMAPGNSAAPLAFPDPYTAFGKVGILICYEDIFPAYARRNVRAGADWHYVATNNAWFGEEAAAWQHAAHSVMRAVETRRPVIRCGNAGWSGWIDAFGHIRHVMLDKANSVYFQGVEAIDFSRNRWWADRLSPYVRFGDWFIGTSALLIVLGLVALRLSPRRDGPIVQRRPLRPSFQVSRPWRRP